MPRLSGFVGDGTACRKVHGYARRVRGHTDKPSRLDIGSFSESLIIEYRDTGQAMLLNK